MSVCSHITNKRASPFVRDVPADISRTKSYMRPMARRGIKAHVNWFFPEWMGYFGIVKQTEIMEKTGWSKATVSQIMSGKQDYSPKIVNEASAAFNLAPYELLMRPDDAMALRRLRADALRIVESTKTLDKTGTDG